MREHDAKNDWDAKQSLEDASATFGIRKPLTATEAAYITEWFELYRLSLYRYLKGLLHSREDANEVLQETYLRLLRQPSFEHVRRNARAYLFQTATNLVRDRFRQRVRNGLLAEAHSLSQGIDAPDLSNWPDLALQGEQLRKVVIAALEELDSSVRLALLLHRFRDLTHRQIAASMGVSERTVERYIRESLAHIAARLEKDS